MLVKNPSTGNIIAENVREATGFLGRLRGLLFSPPLKEGEALLIYPCSSVHTCFMRYPIDVVFLSKDNEIVYLVHEMKPWRFSKVVKNARAVLELPPGTARRTSLNTGDVLEFEG